MRNHEQSYFEKEKKNKDLLTFSEEFSSTNVKSLKTEFIGSAFSPFTNN